MTDDIRAKVRFHWRVQAVIYERFMAGESIASLARDYIHNPQAGNHKTIESVLRSQIRRARGDDYD